jgi:hypothetical protein
MAGLACRELVSYNHLEVFAKMCAHFLVADCVAACNRPPFCADRLISGADALSALSFC